MELVGKKKLTKLKSKNKGNTKLGKAIDQLIDDIEAADWTTPTDIIESRPDADLAHNDGFYFFDINVHRTMILVEFDNDGEATIVWTGDHDSYERIFKNNKNTIKKWLRDNEWIS